MNEVNCYIKKIKYILKKISNFLKTVLPVMYILILHINNYKKKKFTKIYYFT